MDSEISLFIYLFIYLFIVFCLFRVTPAGYGGSQAGGLIGAVAAGLGHSHSNARIWAMSATYTAACGSARSLTQLGQGLNLHHHGY